MRLAAAGQAYRHFDVLAVPGDQTGCITMICPHMQVQTLGVMLRHTSGVRMHQRRQRLQEGKTRQQEETDYARHHDQVCHQSMKNVRLPTGQTDAMLHMQA